MLALSDYFWASNPDATNRGEYLVGEESIQGDSTRAMTEQPRRPSLSPQFCFSQGALRGFLRLSRAAVDDSISQNLNGLMVPSQAGFDPNSTAQRSPLTSPRHINVKACQSFKDRVLLPTWKARVEILDYCALVAASPDPDDPEASLRNIELQKERHVMVDERLDPYSGRFFPREARTQGLANLVKQERAIEDIIRHRTWAVVRDRCVESQPTWEDAVKSHEPRHQARTSFSVK